MSVRITNDENVNMAQDGEIVQLNLDVDAAETKISSFNSLVV